MVKKIKPWHEEDDTLYKEIEADAKDYVDYELEKFKGPFQKNNGRPAKNNQDTGRNCPRCSGLLKLKEIKKSGSVQLYCKDCGIEIFAEDIDYNDPISDKLYRTIPDSMVLYWQEFQRNRKKR